MRYFYTKIINENKKLNKNNGKYENVDKYLIPDMFRHPLVNYGIWNSHQTTNTRLF